MFGISEPWSPDFFPDALWNLMTNVGLVVAVVAFISAVLWLWDRGPKLLIKYGPAWLTTLGLHWDGRRNDGNNESS